MGVFGSRSPRRPGTARAGCRCRVCHRLRVPGIRRSGWPCGSVDRRILNDPFRPIDKHGRSATQAIEPSDRNPMSSLSTPASTTLPAKATAGGALRLLSAAFVLVALTLSPLLWAAVPPLVDYPNHLARIWVLVQNGALPELAQNYVVAWRLLPNLAMDLIVPALAQIMPLEIAGRLFIALTMLSLLAGTMTLHRALYGRLGLWPLSALLFLYNAALFWGFLNCLFGIGMFLLAFSGWISSRDWRTALRILAFSVIASLLLILHLFAFCLYALAVGSYELGQRLRERPVSLRGFLRLCAAGLQFAP